MRVSDTGNEETDGARVGQSHAREERTDPARRASELAEEANADGSPDDGVGLHKVGRRKAEMRR